MNVDNYWMQLALQEAQRALEEDEVPVGAVIVANQQLLARAHNQVERLRDVTAHAEILALTAATQALGQKYLWDCTLYVTLEPCPMCAYALRLAQISRIVFAAPDYKAGFRRFSPELIHPQTAIQEGPYREEAQQLLKAFFEKKRLTP